jgi:hypothetical protein
MDFDTKRRFAYIETRLLWEDGLTARDLAVAFGLTRQTAQGVIDAYRRTYPGELTYDVSLKRQVAMPSFQPHTIRADAGHFLDYLRGQELTAHFLEASDWVETAMTDVSRIIRHRVPPEPTRILIAGMRQRQTVSITYQSKRQALSREFSPHTLIFASNRYHVRGFCHLKGTFLDFVLSRVLHADPSDTAWFSNRDDAMWHDFVELRFGVNPALPPDAQQAAWLDHGIEPGGDFVVHCRKALAFYVQRDLEALDSRFKMPRWLRL